MNIQQQIHNNKIKTSSDISFSAVVMNKQGSLFDTTTKDDCFLLPCSNSPHTINLREVGGVDWLVRPSFKHLPHNSLQSNTRWEVSVDRFEITLFSFIITSQHHSPQGCIERRVMISFFEQLFSDTPLFLIINQDLSMQGYSTLRTSP